MKEALGFSCTWPVVHLRGNRNLISLTEQVFTLLALRSSDQGRFFSLLATLSCSKEKGWQLAARLVPPAAAQEMGA